METYLKALLKCTLPLRICESHLKPAFYLSKVNGKLANLYGRLFVYCVKKREEEEKRMYAMARLFIAYDGALEGGRDQDWWFEQCASRMSESIEYWSGKVPTRVQYEMSCAEPMEYPMAYVYWQNRIGYFRAKEFLTRNKYWIAAVAILGVL
ncbi:hypothetical protein [Vibrio phage PH669]|uniref:Uncharacterized protein n=1 Tax=Vibrio phage PH669 TaxID=2800823 RepID=A0A7T7CLA3_9CAUD|nr:hypothetical protein [Vibrio phage PH669]